MIIIILLRYSKSRVRAHGQTIGISTYLSAQAKRHARHGQKSMADRVKASPPRLDDPFSNVLPAGVAPVGCS